MSSLHIHVDKAEARIAAGRPASIHLVVTGCGQHSPVVSVASRPPGVADEWVSLETAFSGGTTSIDITFDPTHGSRPRPGDYWIDVVVDGDRQRVSRRVLFVVERHPCMQIRPEPSLTFDPFTNTVTMKIDMWSCGNVDLDIDWSARLEGRRLQLEPARVKLLADGSVVDTTLTIALPDGTIDLRSQIDIEATSQGGTTTFQRPILAAPRRRSWPRRRSAAVVGSAAIAATGIVALVGVVAGEESPDASSIATEASDVTEAGNQPPLAADDTASIGADGTVLIDVLANDSDPDGDGLTIASVTQPSQGTTQVVDGVIHYVAAGPLSGSDSFSYEIADGDGGSAAASVTVDAGAGASATSAPANVPPVATDDVEAASEDEGTTIDVLANDSDADGDPLELLAVDQPAAGRATAVNGHVEYTPVPDWNGTVSFAYVIGDGSGGLARATVTLEIAAVNDPPVAAADEATVLEEGSVVLAVLDNDADPDAEDVVVESVGRPSSGKVVSQPDGTLLYTANPVSAGTDRFTYAVADGSGGSAQATVTVTVFPRVLIDNLEVREDVHESGDPPTLTVRLRVPTSERVDIEAHSVSDTATAGEDFVETVRTLAFEPGESVAELPLPVILNDVEPEDREAFTIEATARYPGDLASTATGTVTIRENDAVVE
jgi:hypothetical protein